jgi:subtilisin family serine protease
MAGNNSGATPEMAQPPASTFTIGHGRRYRATILLTSFEQLAGNDLIAGKLTQLGFISVVVTGSGGTRLAEATWSGVDAQIDPHLMDIIELPAATPAIAGSEAPVSAPAIISNLGQKAMGVISAHIFGAESLPSHHDGLLIVQMRPEVLSANEAVARSATAAAPTTAGLNALSYYERAGLIKRVVPLHRGPERGAPAPQMEAASALMFSATPPKLADAGAGISFIELERDQDTQQLHAALANDPNVLSVSKVPVRYLAAPKPRKAPGMATKAGNLGMPPNAAVRWNLKKILWQQARIQKGFQEADDVRVAVLDTGVDDQHPDLKIEAYHWRQPDLSTPVSNKDIIGHGTHVSGTIGALVNGDVWINGICKCRLNVWKIFDDQPIPMPAYGQFMYVVNPIMYRRALAGCMQTPVDVINLSIGGPAPPDWTEQFYFYQLFAAGVTICAAMGNARQNGSPIAYPAAIPGVIAVGATGLDDRVTLFSNSGNHIAVAAPGKAIWSTLPTYAGQSGFSAMLGPNGQWLQGKPIRREMNYDAWDGTSMAAPHVSGCAALLIAKNKAAGKKLTPDEVKKALMGSADKVPAMSGASFSADYGAGRINLAKLLQ